MPASLEKSLSGSKRDFSAQNSVSVRNNGYSRRLMQAVSRKDALSDKNLLQTLGTRHKHAMRNPKAAANPLEGILTANPLDRRHSLAS
jgi:hypothetical protein